MVVAKIARNVVNEMLEVFLSALTTVDLIAEDSFVRHLEIVMKTKK